MSENEDRAVIEVVAGKVLVSDSATGEWHEFTGPDRLARALALADEINSKEM
jgi:hypothetical protein